MHAVRQQTEVSTTRTTTMRQKEPQLDTESAAKLEVMPRLLAKSHDLISSRSFVSPWKLMRKT